MPRPYPFDLAGVTVEWLARANDCSPRTVRRRRASSLPNDFTAADFLSSLDPKLAQRMALLRPSRGILPLWSRLAIAELASQGATYTELAHLFGVSRSTVYRAIHRSSAGYCPLSGQRLLTRSQAAPLGAAGCA
jgi:transposase-like protein